MSFEAMNWAVKVIEAYPAMPPNTRFVLVIMANRADEEGALYPSVRWIMARTGLSETTVRTATREIQRMGLMNKQIQKRDDGGQSSNLYQLSMSQYVLKLVSPPAPHAGGVSPDAPGGAHGEGEGVRGTQGAPARGAPHKTKEETKGSKNLCPLAADVFDRAIKAYPKRAGNDPLRKATIAWNARIREGVDPQIIVAGAQRYARFCAETGKVGTEKVMMRATFFGPDKPYEQDWAPPADPATATSSQAAAPACGWCQQPLTGSWTQTEKGRVCSPCYQGYMEFGKWVVPEKKYPKVAEQGHAA